MAAGACRTIQGYKKIFGAAEIMKNSAEFLYYYLLSAVRKKDAGPGNIRSFLYKKHEYAGKRVKSAADISNLIFGRIDCGKPFMAGRFGATELSALKTFDFEIKSRYRQSLEQMRLWSGFFPETVDAGQRFRDLMLTCIPEADIMGIWALPFEDYYLKHFGSRQVEITYLLDLEPWICQEKPWSAALKGKRVLVIHPFADTIQRQYARRKEIFPGTEILPEFDLKVLKAVQTIAGEKDARFENWFQALDWMCQEALKIEFDVAIIGCGAYGFPLAVKLKQAGKQAIHLGGATQLLFGIKGKRWEENPVFGYVQKFFNESWVYPSESEKPQKASVVEGGCYW